MFTNDFAALRPETPESAEWSDGLLRAEGERGHQPGAVLLAAPRPDAREHGAARTSRRVVDVWAAQTPELGERYRWVQVFENRGAEMGASNPHPHGQIWAGSALPCGRRARTRPSGGTSRRRAGACCSTSPPRRPTGRGWWSERTDWLAIVPFWAVWPFETLVIPRRPAPRLPELDDARATSSRASCSG